MQDWTKAVVLKRKSITSKRLAEKGNGGAFNMLAGNYARGIRIYPNLKALQELLGSRIWKRRLIILGLASLDVQGHIITTWYSTYRRKKPAVS